MTAAWVGSGVFVVASWWRVGGGVGWQPCVCVLVVACSRWLIRCSQWRVRGGVFLVPCLRWIFFAVAKYSFALACSELRSWRHLVL